MKNSSYENVSQRCVWLFEVKNEPIQISSIYVDQLKSMKEFAKLFVQGKFSTLSYNTMRAAAINSTPNGEFKYSFKNNWELLSHLRADAFNTINESRRNLNSKPTKLESNEIEKQALLHAHICSTAYLEIYRFLDTLANNDLSLSAKTRKTLDNFTSQSMIKYRAIFSAENATSIPLLTLVKGGKKK
ncbi:hypothetical protein [Pseudomonas sp. DSP3-2-2]|uniref:hypothetical protein n=1 Tax=unclassified Pseudomonas TaxID=196821 RepID=UPI003CF10B22